MNEFSFFQSLPKVEIHTHLEGSITPSTLQMLAQKNVPESSFAKSLDTCTDLYMFTNFAGFLKAFSITNSFIKESSDIDILVRNAVESFKHEHYMYVEFFISIDTFLKKGIPLLDLLEQLRASQKRYSNSDFIIGGFIIDFVRNYGPVSALAILEELTPILESYRDVILGVSIGGDEHNFPAPPFREVFENARRLRLKTTAHAGEDTDSPDSIWNTILNLKTDRIGHGLKTKDSLDLIKHFRATQTPLEICPTSNIKTGLISSFQEHPIRNFFNNGLFVTINTDDPGFFQNSLSSEFKQLHEVFNFSHEDLSTIVLNAAQSCFLEELSKKELIENLKIRLDKYVL